MRLLTALILIFSSLAAGGQGEKGDAHVSLVTDDTLIQNIFDRAEELAASNITYLDGKRVMIEGAHYLHLWLETQPMGGFMYAKRDPIIARNNIEIFIDYQREDGRFPGVIYNRNGIAEPNYAQFQGFCFADPAWELYLMTGRDTVFLRKLYRALEKFDTYLWRTRDSDGDGCLETWCIYDTGEDHAVRFNGFPNAWAFDSPPSPEAAARLTPEELKISCKQESYDSTMKMIVPIESMDIMSYSYSCRDVLAKISGELRNGMDGYWREKASEVSAKLKEYLWDDQRLACFDRDRDNRTMPGLLHNNLRCMYFGSFDNEMAKTFVQNHLMNPEEFLTPMPLPSVAANDSSFRNISGNNWSGQPQGLTFQRSIRALENYGFLKELTVIGRRFLEVTGRTMTFTQQYDPFRAVATGTGDGYGPSLLAALEFISRLYGVSIAGDRVYWSCLDNDYEYDYSQFWYGKSYRMRTVKHKAICYINGKRVVTFDRGARIVTTAGGELLDAAALVSPADPVTVSNGRSQPMDGSYDSGYARPTARQDRGVQGR